MSTEARVSKQDDLTDHELNTLWDKTERAVVQLTSALSADVRLLINELRRRREMGSREEALAQRLAERNGDLAERQKTLDAAYELIAIRVRERDEARELASDQARQMSEVAQERAEIDRQLEQARAALKSAEKEIIDLRSAGCCGRAG